jgi:hypothetical protein
MPDGLIIALVGLIGAVIGGLIQATVSSLTQKREMAWKSKWDLYAAYFVSLGDLTFYSRDSERHVSALATMAQIRARIAVYGSADVVDKVSKVFAFPDLNSDAAQIAMSEALDAMRVDVGQAKGKVSREQLRKLMFNNRDDK